MAYLVQMYFGPRHIFMAQKYLRVTAQGQFGTSGEHQHHQFVVILLFGC